MDRASLVEDRLLDVRGEEEERENLRHPGHGDADRAGQLDERRGSPGSEDLLEAMGRRDEDRCGSAKRNVTHPPRQK